MLLVKTEVKPSPIAGLGMFAAEPIPAGTVICRWDARFAFRCSAEEHAALPDIVKEYLDKYGWRDTSGDWHSAIDNSKFWNHSFTPNTHGAPEGDCPFVSRALHDIAAGEELTEDYRTFDPDFDTYGKTWKSDPRRNAL